MKSLLILLLLVPGTAFATGQCAVQQQVQQVVAYPQQVQAFQVYSVPVLAQHQNFIQQYGQNVQLQQNVDYVNANQQNVKQKIKTKQVVQRQRNKNRGLRQRAQNINMSNYQVPANAVQKVQGNY